VDAKRPSDLLLLHRPRKSACKRPYGMSIQMWIPVAWAAQFALA
jgi:hypothetical protein